MSFAPSFPSACRPVATLSSRTLLELRLDGNRLGAEGLSFLALPNLATKLITKFFDKASLDALHLPASLAHLSLARNTLASLQGAHAATGVTELDIVRLVPRGAAYHLMLLAP